MDATDYSKAWSNSRNTCEDRTPIVVASGLTAGIALLMASRHPERVSRLILLLPTVEGVRKMGCCRHGDTCRSPGLNRFVYRNYLSRAPFIRGWLTKFAPWETPRASMKKWCGH